MADESSHSSEFQTKLGLLRSELSAQNTRIVEICDAAIEAFFADDAKAAESAMHLDDPIDRADVAIEQQAVAVLCDAAREANELSPGELREILVIVKANNELERIADCAVQIAEQVSQRGGAEIPDTFRVMANSVIGIVRDVCRALDNRDPETAKLVLRAEDTVRGFKASLLRDAEERIAAGTMTVDTAFVLHEIASCCEHIADHATNVAQQVLYAVTGAIVRHCETGWIEINL